MGPGFKSSSRGGVCYDGRAYGRRCDRRSRTAAAGALLEEGIYVIGFSYPVVPVGKSRIRVQLSAAHSSDQIAFALEKFRVVGKRLGAI